MDDSNKLEFKELMDATSEYYQKDRLSKMALQIYFSALSRFTIDQVQEAISLHIQDSKSGQFYPKAVDIIRHLEGGDLTTDKVISEARLKRTPLGVLCAIQIGSWDLKNQADMFYLKQRAEECLQLLPSWKSRALAGEYTDHELSIMLKHDVNPAAPFQAGLPAPECASQIAKRASTIAETPLHQFLLEKPFEGENDKTAVADPSVVKFIEKQMSA